MKERKIYKVNEELIDILLKNGLQEVTEIRDLNSFKILKNEGYNVMTFRRYFEFENKNALEIREGFLRAQFAFGAFNLISTEEFSENQLKSILTFIKLPPQTKRNLFRKDS